MGKCCSKLGLFTREWWKPNPLVLGSQEFLKFPFKVRSQSRSLKPKTTNLARVIVRLKQTTAQLCACRSCEPRQPREAPAASPGPSRQLVQRGLPAAGAAVPHSALPLTCRNPSCHQARSWCRKAISNSQHLRAPPWPHQHSDLHRMQLIMHYALIQLVTNCWRGKEKKNKHLGYCSWHSSIGVFMLHPCCCSKRELRARRMVAIKLLGEVKGFLWQ